MKIAVEGCCHGELDKIYDTVTRLENQNGFKIDLLIICGDFQSVRNFDDLQAMAVPPKYQKLNTFYKYYSGERVAPVLTVIIGGNHEASNYLQELPYGGWVATNIYYLGYAGIIQVGGVRIGGLSGIYKGMDFNKGHFETPPYNDSSMRSVYHVRNLEVFRLKQISRHVDIFISHDWPTGVYHNGDVAGLLRAKPFFKDEVEAGTLGSKPCAELLAHLKPSYWFAAHLHVKFAAYIEHPPQNEKDQSEPKSTKFLALDKCLPRKRFLQVLDIPHNIEEGLKIKLDPEWLRILQSTNHLLNTTAGTRYMPGPNGNEKYDFRVTNNEIAEIQSVFGGDMSLPENFVITAPSFTGNPHQSRHRRNPLFIRINPQTTLLCTMLDITDPNAKAMGKTSEEILKESNIGLCPQADDDDDIDDGDEDNNDGDKNRTFNPSYIDSSMDSSKSFSGTVNISESWDRLCDKQKSEASSTTTPMQTKVNVADDDEELLSILSAQKTLSLTPHLSNASRNEPSSSSSPNLSLMSPPLSRSVTDPCVSSTPIHPKPDSVKVLPESSHNLSTKLSVADRLKALKTKNDKYKAESESASSDLETSNKIVSTTDSQCLSDFKRSHTLDLSHIDALCSENSNLRSSRLSGTDSVGNSSVSSSCSVIGSSSDTPPMKRDNSDTPPMKRDSSDLLDSSQGSHSDCERSQVTSSSSSVKKLKRRNVSVYQETVE